MEIKDKNQANIEKRVQKEIILKIKDKYNRITYINEKLKWFLE